MSINNRAVKWYPIVVQYSPSSYTLGTLHNIVHVTKAELRVGTNNYAMFVRNQDSLV